jgi:hypothetical protein
MLAKQCVVRVLNQLVPVIIGAGAAYGQHGKSAARKSPDTS